MTAWLVGSFLRPDLAGGPLKRQEPPRVDFRGGTSLRSSGGRLGYR
jgi:hypothetical protein